MLKTSDIFIEVPVICMTLTRKTFLKLITNAFSYLRQQGNPVKIVFYLINIAALMNISKGKWFLDLFS